MKLREEAAHFDISLLDYCETSNHVHLLAFAEDTGQICQFMQRVEGQFAQSYNRRKKRRGAFWEDRFHSTTVEPGGHLEACMVYIALNMVRCGVVTHPREWPWCGYHELMGLRQRFRILDFEQTLALLGAVSAEEFRRNYEAMIQERIAKDQKKREPRWTEAIAVGSESFVREAASRVEHRQRLEIELNGENWVLKEPGVHYNAFPV
ncbi:MAG: transposase [Verrucomicrobia bacterium]|nr:transposase [Verrucomicrobiota bacterium]